MSGDRVRHVEHVMGTAVTFDVLPGPLGMAVAEDAIAAACALLHDVDDTFSLWKPNSPMSRLRRGETSRASVPLVIGEVLTTCVVLREMTGGWFDSDRMPGGADPTGYVKGWAVQRALEVLRARGAEAALVNGGGDAAAFGRPEAAWPWRLGLRDPRQVTGLVGIIALELPHHDGHAASSADETTHERMALATSGTYERGEHLVDPWTGQPASSDVLSASVLGPDLGVADALATALAVGGRTCAAMLDAPGYSGLLVHADGSRTVVGDFRLLPMPSFGAAGLPPTLAPAAGSTSSPTTRRAS